MAKTFYDVRTVNTALVGRMFYYCERTFIQSWLPASWRNNILGKADWAWRVSAGGAFTTIGGDPVRAIVPGGSTDANGRTCNESTVLITDDRYTNGGRRGLSYDVNLDLYYNGVLQIDGPYFDDPFTGPRSTDNNMGCDWTNGAGGDPTTVIQAGQLELFQKVRDLLGQKVASNTPLTGNAGSYSAPAALAASLDSGLLENVQENGSYGGFNGIRNMYREAMKVYKADGCPIYQVQGVQADGSGPWYSNGSFRGMSAPDVFVLYHLAACMTLGNAFFSAVGGYGVSQWLWFKWYSIDRATGLPYTFPSVDAGRHWAGNAVTGPQVDSPQADGTYRREWDYGYSWVNPEGNGQRSVTIPVNCYVAGTGQYLAAGASYSMAERTGLLLVKV